MPCNICHVAGNSKSNCNGLNIPKLKDSMNVNHGSENKSFYLANSLPESWSLWIDQNVSIHIISQLLL